MAIRVNEGVLQLRQEKFIQYQTSFLMALAEGLILSDRLTEACSAIDEAMRQCEESGEAWALAELLRLRAETLLRNNPDEAEDQFLQSIRIARSQGALAWELRTATSLARKLRDEGRQSEARALLAPVRGRFSEGGDTADIRSATLLLENLSPLNPGEL